MAENVVVNEVNVNPTNPTSTRKQRLAKIIRFIVSFDMVLFFIYFALGMVQVHSYLTMEKRHKNGTIKRIAPFNLTTTDAGYFYLASEIIHTLFRLFPVILLFMSTNKSNNENDPKRCVYLIKLALSIITCLDVFICIGILGFINSDEVPVAVKWVFGCIGVYKVVFLIFLYNQACSFLNFLPTVAVASSNYVRYGASGTQPQSQMVVVVAQGQPHGRPQPTPSSQQASAPGANAKPP